MEVSYPSYWLSEILVERDLRIWKLVGLEKPNSLSQTKLCESNGKETDLQGNKIGVKKILIS